MTEQERLDEKEKLIHEDLRSIENKVRHAFNQGYELGLKQKQQQSKWDSVLIVSYEKYEWECHRCKAKYNYRYSYCPSCGSRMVSE